MIIVQVSGTRDADKTHLPNLADALAPIRDAYPGADVVLRHGDAEGVDKLCGNIADSWGWKPDPVPARWFECGEGCPGNPHLTPTGRCPFAGPRRNRIMLATLPRPDFILAFPAIGAKGKGGTWGFMREAAELGFVIHRVVPLRVQPVRAAVQPKLIATGGAA